MAEYTIAVIPGDGIGREIVPEALRVLEAISDVFGIGFRFNHYDWSCDTFRQTGRMIPADGLARLRDHDAILFGAIGSPDVPDDVSVWGLVLPIRREFEQWVNLRPVRSFECLTPNVRLAPHQRIDLWVVRENVEGEYTRIGGRFNSGTSQEFAVQQAVFTKQGTERIMRYAFELSRRTGRKRVTSVTKSNALIHSMTFWDERFYEISAEYPEIGSEKQHVDALAARMVRNPASLDVIVASNLFGDILSDLGPALVGSLGLAPSANLNPSRAAPSMFEPVHGSAPDIAGRGIANPIGQIGAAMMMLDHLGQAHAAEAIRSAIEVALSNPAHHTPDLSGTARTTDVGHAIADAVRYAASR